MNNYREDRQVTHLKHFSLHSVGAVFTSQKSTVMFVNHIPHAQLSMDAHRAGSGARGPQGGMQARYNPPPPAWHT